MKWDLALFFQYIIIPMLAVYMASVVVSADDYQGRYCSGKGDVEFLRLIDNSFEFFHPNPNRQNISMLYRADWDCLTEGPDWGKWWIQNSYGPTYCCLPFLQEPWLTFLQHSQDFWFKYQGDGKSHDLMYSMKPADVSYVPPAPDGSLCDTAGADGAIHRQGDGHWLTHDWFFEATAAGVVLQSELLLISHDTDAICRYFPNLERACDFVETRRDPASGLFSVGAASNLLAPSYGGIKQSDGTFGRGYLAGLSITYLAALDRMVELCKLMSDREKVALYESRREITRKSLPLLITPEGYFVKSVALDGTKHGVLGQKKYGYFDTSPNVDAICHRVADQALAEKIYAQIVRTPELRPYAFLIANYPGLDDMYISYDSTDAPSIWKFGCWVNGGVWTTVEARAIMAYYRLGKHEDVLRSVRRTMELADDFQLDAPLIEFGKDVWHCEAMGSPNRSWTLCYDSLGPPAAVVRGLFEYIYKADSLTLYPHIPPSISEYTQREPIRFGKKRITIGIKNGGDKIKSVKINGRRRVVDNPDCIVLAYDTLPAETKVEITTAGGWSGRTVEIASTPASEKRPATLSVELPEYMSKRFAVLKAMQEHIARKPACDYAWAFLREAIATFDAYSQRFAGDRASTYSALGCKRSRDILKLYRDTAITMFSGFDNLMGRYKAEDDTDKNDMAKAWSDISRVVEAGGGPD